MIGFLGAAATKQKKTKKVKQKLPAPGSVNTSPVVVPPGGWPAFKGTPGPKQQKCTQTGGAWIGPEGRRWCQMPGPLAVPETPSTPSAPSGPADTAKVPDGEKGGSPRHSEEQAVKDVASGSGPIAASAEVQDSSGAVRSSFGFLVGAAVIGGIVFLVLRGQKGGKLGGKGKRRK